MIARFGLFLALALAALTAMPTGIAAACAPGMIHYWNADNNYADQVGTATLSPSAGVSFQAGQFDQAFDIDAPAWLDAGQPITLPGTGVISADGWVLFHSMSNAPPGQIPNTIIANDDGAGNNEKWIVFVSSGQLMLHVNGPTSGSAFAPLGAFAPALDTWHHIAIMAQPGGVVKSWIDGAPAATLPFAGAFPAPTSPARLGEAEGLGFLDGRVDDFAIWDIALDDAHVAALYANGPSAKCTTSPPPVPELPALALVAVGVAALALIAVRSKP